MFFFSSRWGYATLHNVEDKSTEDRMESFFLSETVKYLYLVCLKDFVSFSFCFFKALFWYDVDTNKNIINLN